MPLVLDPFIHTCFEYINMNDIQTKMRLYRFESEKGCNSEQRE